MAITSNGFERKTLVAIKNQLDAAFSGVLGDINTAPDSVTGQWIGVLAAEYDALYQKIEDTYLSAYVATAEGSSLDGAVAYKGLIRIKASNSSVYGICVGTEGTVIPSGSIARSLSFQYLAKDDTVISRSKTGLAEIKVTNVPGFTYEIGINGTNYSYTDSTGITSDIVSGLALALSGIVSVEELDGSIKLMSPDGETPFICTTGSNLEFVKIGSPVFFEAALPGIIYCPKGSLNTIDTSVIGWDEVINIADGNIGRDQETDEELRARFFQSASSFGKSTEPAIVRDLMAIDGVTFAVVNINSSDSRIGDMPAHSIECIVEGSYSQIIAQTIWDAMAAGISTYGNFSGVAIDANGENQTVYFSRPVDVYGWIKIDIIDLYTEEELGNDPENNIKASVLAYALSLKNGEDLIPGRFYHSVYNAVAGIGQISVSLAITANSTDTPSYSTGVIPVSSKDKVTYDLSRIEVIGL